MQRCASVDGDVGDVGNAGDGDGDDDCAHLPQEEGGAGV